MTFRKFAMSGAAVSSLAAAMVTGTTTPAEAQVEPFLGQIMWFGGNFCPRGWASASGQILSIQQNTALFSLLGTTYGGNGQTTFALPDLRGRVTIGPGQGPGLSPYDLGQVAGTETVTIIQAQMPAHNHTASSSIVMRGNSGGGDTTNPAGNVLAAGGTNRVYSTAASNVDMDATSVSAPTSVGSSGNGQPFNNLQPIEVHTACIALQGIFPSRN